MLFNELVEKQTSERQKRGSHYDKFTGKGALAKSGRIPEVHMADLMLLKNVSEMHLHKENRFLVVGLNNRETGKYDYAVIDLSVEDIKKADVPVYPKIKEAKEYIAEVYNETTEDEPDEETPAEEPTEEPAENPQSSSRRKK